MSFLFGLGREDFDQAHKFRVGYVATGLALGLTLSLMPAAMAQAPAKKEAPQAWTLLMVPVAEPATATPAATAPKPGKMVLALAPAPVAAKAKPKAKPAPAVAVTPAPVAPTPNPVVAPAKAEAEAPAEDSNTARQKLIQDLDAMGNKFEAQEVALKAWLNDQPSDEELRARLARVLSWQKKYDASLAEYHTLLVHSPKDADYLLGQGQVQLWAGRPADAVTSLDAARAIAPQYQDIYEVELQALNALKDKPREDALRAEAKTRFPEGKWDVPPPEVAVAEVYKPFELELGNNYESLSNNFTHWGDQYIWGRKIFSPNAGVYGQVRTTQRFGLDDYEFMGGGYFPVSKKWGLAVEATGSPTGKVLPNWSLYGQAQRKLPLGFVAIAGFRHVDYSDAITDTANYTLEWYKGNFRFAYTLYEGRLHGAGNAASSVGNITYYYGEHNYVGLTGSTGKELANVLPVGVQSFHVDAVALNGIHWMTPRWALTYLLLLQRQDNLYTRRGAQLGVRYAF